MSTEELTSKFRKRLSEGAGFDATLKFDMDDDGVIFLDGNTVSNEDADADCTVGVSLADLTAMVAGELDPMAAFSLGKLRIEGDMGVAMKLGSLLR